MAGGNFMHRVLSYIVNELVVDRLANSYSFQRFAVKSSKAFEEISQREEAEEMAAVNKRQPPPGYPTEGNAKEKAPPVEDNKNVQQANGEDEDETDRGISAQFVIRRAKPRLHERYPGPGLVPFDDYELAPPRGRYNPAPVYDYAPPHGQRRHGFQPHVSYAVSGGYGHQPIPKPPQYYRHETYVVDQPPPPPPPRRRPVYPPHGNYYVRDEYARY